MNLIGNIILNIFSDTILIIIYFYYYHHVLNVSIQNKLFVSILHTTLLLLVIDSFGRLDGYPGTILTVINNFSNLTMFLLSPILPSLWILFVDSYINQSEKLNKRLIFVLAVINGLSMIWVIVSQLFGWNYSIDSNNVYHRGPYYFITVLLSVVLLLSASILVATKYNKLENKQFWAFQFFIVPPFIGIALQVFIYGYSLVLNCVVISILITFLYIQNQDINIDYLTGIYNRKMLEILLNKKVNTSTDNKTFAAIMIDLNNFKYINDTFGHIVGDEALQTTARLLKGCIRARDFIARYGGDEFCIILDVSDNKSLENIVSRINNAIDKYNKTNNNPFKLGLSMGYSVYEFKSNLNAEEFKNKIDKLMYINKNEDKEKTI